jgi:hypothetical protein
VSGAGLAVVVATVVRELVVDIIPWLVDKAKDELKERGVDIDAQIEKQIDRHLEDLVDQLSGTVSEFVLAEARGKAHPLGGDGIELTELTDAEWDEQLQRTKPDAPAAPDDE